MYANEKKYVVPFMSATVGLFLAGAWFGYTGSFPARSRSSSSTSARHFTPILTIEDYTGFFLAVILGLGIML